MVINHRDVYGNLIRRENTDPISIMRIGCKFDTKSERGCICQSLPDRDGNFDGIDSDGVECSFLVRQVVRVY